MRMEFMGKSMQDYMHERKREQMMQEMTQKPEEADKNGCRDEIMSDTRRKIKTIFRELGVPVNLKGYNYLWEAIEYCVYLERNKKISIMKLYEDIGKGHDDTVCRVERAMRHAVERAWERGNTEAMNRIFGYAISSEKGKPTTSEFIMTIADEIKLDEENV